MKKKYSLWRLSSLLFFILCSSAYASPTIIKELTGREISSLLQHTFQEEGAMLTLDKKPFVVVNPAICYGAASSSICRVKLGYQQNSNENSLLTKMVTLTYKKPRPPAKALTIISAIEYF